MLNQFLTDEGDGPRSVRLETAATPCLEGAAALGLGTNDQANIDLTEVNLG
jgi:hypothetical protein